MNQFHLFVKQSMSMNQNFNKNITENIQIRKKPNCIKTLNNEKKKQGWGFFLHTFMWGLGVETLVKTSSQTHTNFLAWFTYPIRPSLAMCSLMSQDHL